jgi:hypothetical protein
MRYSLLVFVLLLAANVQAAVEKIPSGSFIINMGIEPQTVQNGLKPYGLVYEMLQVHHVPVKWVINPAKASRSEPDFTYNNMAYKGGCFVISAAYRTSGVDEAIQKWIAKGVVGETLQSDLNLDVYAMLTYAPRWTIDRLSPYTSVVLNFFANAEIPATAYGGALPSGWKSAAELSECDDIFIFPHADPTWAQHSNLLTWNQQHRGAIWAGCHTPSVLEAVTSPDKLLKMNFLTTGQLIDYTQHAPAASFPLIYREPTNPISQFLGTVNQAVTNGTENFYLPVKTAAWRPGTTLLVETPSGDIPGKSSGPGAVSIYGRGHDNPNHGYVMYQGGHFHNGSSPEHVALQRSFFNFSLLSVIDRQSTSIRPEISAPLALELGGRSTVKFTLPPGTDRSKFSVRWSASAGTIQPGNTPDEIVYIAPTDLDIKLALITLILTDGCGRQYFKTSNVNLNCTSDGFSPQILADTRMRIGNSYPVSFDVPANIDLGKYTVVWNAEKGAITVDPGAANKITYKAPDDITQRADVITAVLTDKCGREIRLSHNIELFCETLSFTPQIISPDTFTDDERFTATFSMPSNLDTAAFQYSWEIVNGEILGSAHYTSALINRPFYFPATTITLKLTVTDLCGNVVRAEKTLQRRLEVTDGGEVTVVKLISPNDDSGGYDFLYIKNIFLFPGNELTIYNRWGVPVYNQKGYDNFYRQFTGTGNINGSSTLPGGVYYYVLKLNETNSVHKDGLVKGYFVLKR